MPTRFEKENSCSNQIKNYENFYCCQEILDKTYQQEFFDNPI